MTRKFSTHRWHPSRCSKDLHHHQSVPQDSRQWTSCSNAWCSIVKQMSFVLKRVNAQGCSAHVRALYYPCYTDIESCKMDQNLSPYDQNLSPCAGLCRCLFGNSGPRVLSLLDPWSLIIKVENDAMIWYLLILLTKCLYNRKILCFYTMMFIL